MTPATRARISELLTALEAWAESANLFPDAISNDAPICPRKHHPDVRCPQCSGPHEAGWNRDHAAHLDAPATIRELGRLWRGEEEA